MIHEFEAEGFFLADQQILNLDKALLLDILCYIKPYLLLILQSASILLQILDISNDSIDIAVVFDHLLVVASALVSGSCFHPLAH